MDAKLDTVWGKFGVSVELRRLPKSTDGEYVHRKKPIRIQRGLLTRPYRSTPAHECAHAMFADQPTRFGPVHLRQERRADRWAAHTLIGLDSYREAERRHDGNVEAIAVMLDVTVDLVDAYRALLLRTDRRTYVAPKMGVGQWQARVDVAEPGQY